MQHMYKKLGVHGKEELDALVGGEGVEGLPRRILVAVRCCGWTGSLEGRVRMGAGPCPYHGGAPPGPRLF